MLKSLRLRVQPLGAAALILFASALQASAVTVTVTDLTPTLKAEKTGCCFDPECPKCSIWAGLPTATDTLDDAIFGYAWDYWNNEPGDPKGWALVKGGVLNGSFNIAVYDAGFTTTTPPCKAGVEIKMYYAPGSGDPSISDVVWAQAIAISGHPR
jgi:hypothetical protein